MTTEQILQVLDQYDRQLHILHDCPSARCYVDPPFDDEVVRRQSIQLQHVRWMCEQIPRFLDAGQVEKSYRWLGFIQGVLWANNIYTIEEMRTHNRNE